jgi:hypothetical protein
LGARRSRRSGEQREEQRTERPAKGVHARGAIRT